MQQIKEVAPVETSSYAAVAPSIGDLVLGHILRKVHSVDPPMPFSALINGEQNFLGRNYPDIALFLGCTPEKLAIIETMHATSSGTIPETDEPIAAVAV